MTKIIWKVDTHNFKDFYLEHLTVMNLFYSVSIFCMADKLACLKSKTNFIVYESQHGILHTN